MKEQVLAPTQRDLARAAAYQTLAWGFTYPTAERIEQLSDWLNALVEAFSELDLTTDAVVIALAALREKRLETLQVEHTRLFINAVPHVLAPPYASAYDGGGQLMGEPAAAALRAYQRAGLTLSAERRELPDHLATELEFMFFLISQELAARGSGNPAHARSLREQQEQFLAEQLLPWVPSWRKKVEPADRTRLYKTLAQLTESWLQSDAKYLAVSLEGDL